jgi:hypothetical protein
MARKTDTTSRIELTQLVHRLTRHQPAEAAVGDCPQLG